MIFWISQDLRTDPSSVYWTHLYIGPCTMFYSKPTGLMERWDSLMTTWSGLVSFSVSVAAYHQHTRAYHQHRYSFLPLKNSFVTVMQPIFGIGNMNFPVNYEPTPINGCGLSLYFAFLPASIFPTATDIPFGGHFLGSGESGEKGSLGGGRSLRTRFLEK